MSTRILIADDSLFWREELKTILEEDSDWTVFEACNGFDALQKSNWIQPHLVVLDLSMPELDGLSAARELKRRTPEVPVLIITVDKSDFLEVLARQAGVIAVFSKMECAYLKNFVRHLFESEGETGDAFEPSEAADSKDDRSRNQSGRSTRTHSPPQAHAANNRVA
jgi:DNA-binding NarL/FixJ family response regulator